MTSNNIASYLASLIAAKRRVLFVGPPGCAKTARIAAAAAAAGHDLVVFRLSLAERVDLGGCLVPDAAAGITRALPLELLHRLRTTTKPTVLLLDDLGQGPTDVQAGSMSLFDKGALPDHVLIWGATNRPGDKSGAPGLCEPLRSRFHHRDARHRGQERRRRDPRPVEGRGRGVVRLGR
jgi:MoxR-like ATPase